jgi:hypothetical protein
MKWIRDYQWKKCSDDQITHLDLTVATPTDLMNIFSGLSYLESDLENDKHRFSLLSPATVNANLSKFDEFNFDLLTQEQWAVLDTKEVTKTIFCMMFSIPDFSKAMRRFEQLSPAQQDDLKARFGDEWIIQHITK